MARGLLRLVHSLERRPRGHPYSARLELAAADAPADAPAWSALTRRETATRAFVIGTGDRVDLAAPGGLLTRHLAVITVPQAEGVLVRVVSLHPDRALQVPAEGLEGVPVGSAESFGALEVVFDGFRLRVWAELEHPPSLPGYDGVSVLPLGEQLAFFADHRIKPVGNVLSSIGGPVGGGHAIPALVADLSEPPALGSLVLHGRSGVHRLEPSWSDLRRGILIGRSRRCMLGRGFDENDGLSRVHALACMLDDGMWVFDLASRYGLRDVAKPSRLLLASRLDDGAGCLVYGAGHLIFEG